MNNIMNNKQAKITILLEIKIALHSRKFLEKKVKESRKVQQKKIYTEILIEIHPSGSFQNENDTEHFPPDLGTRVSRKRHQQEKYLPKGNESV